MVGGYPVQQAIRLTFLAGLVAFTVYGGSAGRLIYLAVVLLVIAVFRRPLVVALTHLASKLGMMRKTVETMPDEIHLTRSSSSAQAARQSMALAERGFVHAGAWNINEMPKIEVTLLVHPVDCLLAAVESFPVGAHVNVHTLYPDGSVVSFTNTALPVPETARPNTQRTRVPRASPGALVDQARRDRPAGPFRKIETQEAPRLYEQLYADEIRFRKYEIAAPRAIARSRADRGPATGAQARGGAPPKR
jgi:hypothetical protein